MSWNKGKKGQDLRAPRDCPTCGQLMSRELLVKRENARRAKIKEALANSDEQLGRPRSVDYERIKELRRQGLSIQKIADKLGTSQRTVSRGAVEHCLKTKDKP